MCEKLKIAPPMRKEPPLKRLNLRNFGRKIALNFGENLFFFFFFFFFGDHLILGGKNVRILDFLVNVRNNVINNVRNLAEKSLCFGIF